MNKKIGFKFYNLEESRDIPTLHACVYADEKEIISEIKALNSPQDPGLEFILILMGKKTKINTSEKSGFSISANFDQCQSIYNVAFSKDEGRSKITVVKNESAARIFYRDKTVHESDPATIREIASLITNGKYREVFEQFNFPIQSIEPGSSLMYEVNAIKKPIPFPKEAAIENIVLTFDTTNPQSLTDAKLFNFDDYFNYISEIAMEIEDHSNIYYSDELKKELSGIITSAEVKNQQSRNIVSIKITGHYFMVKSILEQRAKDVKLPLVTTYIESIACKTGLITHNIMGAPFNIGDIITYTGLSDDSESIMDNCIEDEDENAIMRLPAKVIAFDYSSGTGQSYPEDPLIKIEFSNGKRATVWSDEIKVA